MDGAKTACLYMTNKVKKLNLLSRRTRRNWKRIGLIQFGNFFGADLGGSSNYKFENNLN